MKILMKTLLILGIMLPSLALANMTLQSSDLNRYVGQGYILSDAYPTIDVCSETKNKYNETYPDYTRSECFESNNRYYYFICSGGSCRVISSDNGDAGSSNADRELAGALGLDYEEEEIPHLNRLIRFLGIVGSQEEKLGDKYESFLDQILGKLDTLSEQFEGNRDISIMVDYLTRGVQNIKNNYLESSDIQNFFCELTGNCGDDTKSVEDELNDSSKTNEDTGTTSTNGGDTGTTSTNGGKCILTTNSNGKVNGGEVDNFTIQQCLKLCDSRISFPFYKDYEKGYCFFEGELLKEYNISKDNTNTGTTSTNGGDNVEICKLYYSNGVSSRSKENQKKDRDSCISYCDSNPLGLGNVNYCEWGGDNIKNYINTTTSPDGGDTLTTSTNNYRNASIKSEGNVISNGQDAVLIYDTGGRTQCEIYFGTNQNSEINQHMFATQDFLSSHNGEFRHKINNINNEHYAELWCREGYNYKKLAETKINIKRGCTPENIQWGRGGNFNITESTFHGGRSRSITTRVNLQWNNGENQVNTGTQDVTTRFICDNGNWKMESNTPRILRTNCSSNATLYNNRACKFNAEQNNSCAATIKNGFSLTITGNNRKTTSTKRVGLHTYSQSFKCENGNFKEDGITYVTNSNNQLGVEIIGIYKEVLGRNPDQGGFTFWFGHLGQKNETRHQRARHIAWTAKESTRNSSDKTKAQEWWDNNN